MKTREEQNEAIRRIVSAVEDAIRDAKEIPSGHLYAALMSTGVTLDAYNSIIGVLQKMGKIEVLPSHLIRWKGGAS